VAAEEVPHVVYGLGRGPPPEPDAPPGLGVNSLGAFESWSRPAAAAGGWVFRGACWSTVEMRYGPVVLLLVFLVGSKRLRGVVHDRAMRQYRGRAVATARAVAAGEAALSQSQADLSLSARQADLHHASAGESLRARQVANASRPSLHWSPSPFDWRARLLGAAPAALVATPGDARRDLRRSPSRTPSVCVCVFFFNNILNNKILERRKVTFRPVVRTTVYLTGIGNWRIAPAGRFCAGFRKFSGEKYASRARRAHPGLTVYDLPSLDPDRVM
jgi:hypothetical protein